MNKKNPWPNFVFIIPAAGFFLFAVIYYFSFGLRVNLKKMPPSGNTIILTDKGFEPEEIMVKPGDAVVFKNQSGRDFWPASDLHPSHALYSEFDAKMPIPSNNSWEFVFTKPGSWRFHDHLFPNNRGLIHVVESGKNLKVREYTLEYCEGLTDQANCWNELLEQTIQNQGLKQAWEIVDSLYRTKPKFSQDCHGYTHKLGQKAYQLFANKQDIPLGNETSYCGYGFFHGFMEELLASSGNFEEAKAFCRDISGRVSETLADACYHGIGHGAQALAVSTVSNYGQVDLVLEKALEVCGLATDSSLTFSRCASGVFMELGQYLATGEYNLKPDRENPFSLCEAQTNEASKMPCYAQLYILLSALSGENFKKAASFVEQIKEDRYAVEAIQTLAGTFAETEDSLKACQSIEARLRSHCVSGLALGRIMQSKPGEEYTKALLLCSDKRLKAAERDACYNLVLGQAFRLYGETKLQEICAQIPKGFECEAGQNF